MSTLDLTWRLARAGGRFRTIAVVAGNAIGTTLFLLTMAIPAAVRDPHQAITSDERLLAMSVVVFLCLPITVLLMSIGRLSASTRDRRLASLRMLGLSPARTRLVAGLENGILSGLGAILGLAASLGVVPLVEAAATGQGWLLQPLGLSWASTGLVCAGLVLLSVVVSLAPTRSLQRGPMQVRRVGATARPSLWRVLPLVAGAGVLVTVLALPTTTENPVISQATMAYMMLTGAFLAGIGLLIALPVAVRGVADLVTRHSGGVMARLAARRLQAEPASTVRTVAGLTIAVFLITGATGVLAELQALPQYASARQAYEEGPQHHLIIARPANNTDAGSQKDTDALRSTKVLARQLQDAAGVQSVIPSYSIGVAGSCGSPEDFCGNVFVGTCADLALIQPVQGCRDDTVSIITTPLAGIPSVERQSLGLVNGAGNTATVTPSHTILVTSDKAWARSFSQASLFIPVTSPQIAPILGNPTAFDVLTGPGQAPRTTVKAIADRLGVEVHLEDLEVYQGVQGYQLLLSTLAVIVLGIGLLAVLITTIDRAIERRRQVAGQVALGVPIRVLRGSQLVQTLVPLWLGLVAAVGLGYLTVLAYLKLGAADAPVAAPADTIVSMAVAALMGAAVVAAATLPGIGRRLTPDLLRRE
jgi:hypothetical protein